MVGRYLAYAIRHVSAGIVELYVGSAAENRLQSVYDSCLKKQWPGYYRGFLDWQLVE